MGGMNTEPVELTAALATFDTLWSPRIVTRVNDYDVRVAKVAGEHVWHRHDDAVICVYDLAKFGGETVIDIMRTHPLVVIGGSLHQNPFFVPPEEFLSELRERRAARAAPQVL